MINKKNIGSSFDDFLAEDNLLEICEEHAIKEILAEQIQMAMKAEGLNKTAMAQRMKTSRQALNRLLDPSNSSVTLHTMQRAATAVGRKLTLKLQ
jgi:antitoxin HicB